MGGHRKSRTPGQPNTWPASIKRLNADHSRYGAGWSSVGNLGGSTVRLTQQSTDRFCETNGQVDD